MTCRCRPWTRGTARQPPLTGQSAQLALELLKVYRPSTGLRLFEPLAPSLLLLHKDGLGFTDRGVNHCVLYDQRRVLTSRIAVLCPQKPDGCSYLFEISTTLRGIPLLLSSSFSTFYRRIGYPAHVDGKFGSFATVQQSSQRELMNGTKLPVSVVTDSG
jgi:hypothetical protein